MYCITSALDRHITLPDRTPHTQMMRSHSIFSKNFYNPWYTHLKKYYPLSSHFASVQIASIQLTTHRQSVSLDIIHRSRDLGMTCGTHHCGENMENVVEEMDNRILRETRCHLWKSVFKEFDSVRFNVSSLLVLYAQI